MYPNGTEILLQKPDPGGIERFDAMVQEPFQRIFHRAIFLPPGSRIPDKMIYIFKGRGKGELRPYGERIRHNLVFVLRFLGR